MKRSIQLILVCSSLFHYMAHAGIQEGVDAFTRGQYNEAKRELEVPAESKNPIAMAYMGEMLLRGYGGARDELKARNYIMAAHEAGQVRATYQLGLLYLSGNLVNKDIDRSVSLIKEAAEKSHPPAQSLLGAWFSNGVNGFTKDEDAALPWFKLSAEKNDPLAMQWMGYFYENGKANLTKDLLLAIDYYRKSARLGNIPSQVELGRMYALGIGVAADGNEALRWLRQAASVNNHLAFYWIGNVYEFGRGGVLKNPSLAYSWYHNIPNNTLESTLKRANEGKERLTKTLSSAEIAEAEKQSKPVLNANSATLLTSMLSAFNNNITRRGVYGSGVIVSPDGDILTNEHVIQNCAKVRVQPQGWDVKVMGKDAKNDLAILKLDNRTVTHLPVRAGKGIRLGDEIIALGYPLRGTLSSGPIVTTGIVNALSGFNNDTSTFQMSATVQPGSSGGPIFDRYGLLVGIVRARLLTTAPSNPQNVNFGVNLATVSGFLDAHDIAYTALPIGQHALSIADVTEKAQKATVQIECY